MPGFIKTPKDEAKWKKMKEAVSRSKGKPESEFTDRDWALTNYLWHKSEGEMEKAEELLKGMLKTPSISIPNPAKVGIPSVKMPRKAKQPDPFGKPSLFFKNLERSEIEEFEHVKHPTLCKLRDFLQKKHKQ